MFDGVGNENPAPLAFGSILVVRDGDLHLREGQSERQLTHSGDYVTGVITHNRHVIAIQESDEGASLVRLEVEVSRTRKTAEIALNRQATNRQRPLDLLLSPDAESVVVRVGSGHLLIELASGRPRELLPQSLSTCCVSWSPDGTLVALLARADNRNEQEAIASMDRSYDLWVVEARDKAAPRRLAKGLMRWRDPYGRRGESLAWWGTGGHLLTLSSSGAHLVERGVIGAGLKATMNNQLISVGLTTGTVRYRASAPNLREQMSREVALIHDEVAITAPATTRVHQRAAFLTMDYGNTYGIGTLNADEQLDLITKSIPGGLMVRMGAPVWSPDGARLAYLGWHERPKRMAFIEVLHAGSGRIERIWESDIYPKPGHWDWAPNGEWVWIALPQHKLSLLVRADGTGSTVTVPGTILDWCCVRQEK